MSKIKTKKLPKKPLTPLGKQLGATTKVHNENSIDSNNSRNSMHNAQETDMQFELELCWCVHQLENALQLGKLSTKIAEDTLKNLKILKSSTAPLIKKRQVMKAALGDYRSKMKAEEKKLSLAPKQIKFTKNAVTNTKCNFVKKSAILTSGKDFKFNFNPIIENVDDKNQQKNLNETENLKTVEDDIKSGVFCKDLCLGSGVDFKFNFAIDEVNEELKFNELSIET